MPWGHTRWPDYNSNMALGHNLGPKTQWPNLDIIEAALLHKQKLLPTAAVDVEGIGILV